MRKLLLLVEVVAAIVGIVLMLLFIAVQTGVVLAPRLQAVAESHLWWMWICIIGTAVLFELSRYIRSKVFE